MTFEMTTDVTTGTTIEAIYGIAAPNREELMTYARAFIGGLRPTDNPPFLRIVLPCGNSREWLTESDVPARSIECRCRDLDYQHFFIKYTEPA